jgi:hypothetical protein
MVVELCGGDDDGGGGGQILHTYAVVLLLGMNRLGFRRWAQLEAGSGID